MMPTDTPHGTESFVDPNAVAKDTPWARSSASRTAISSAALAIRWPLNFASSGATLFAVRSSAASRAGTRKVRRTCSTPSTYSEE